jgi:RNA-binding protein 25
VAAVFNPEEDDESRSQAKKRKVKMITYSAEEALKVGLDPEQEKRNTLKRLAEMIPTKKEPLFAYDLDWETVDYPFIAKHVRPWVCTKVKELLGTEELSLVGFICEQMLQTKSPFTLLENLGRILDDDAEVFVLKLWRLLIYEVEAKKLGLTS